MKNKLRLGSFAFFLAAILAGYQNCGKYNFASAPTQASQNVGPTGGLTGGTSPTPDNTPPPTCVLTSADIPIVSTLPTGVTSAMIQSICPATGNDTECGFVIIAQDGPTGTVQLSLYFTGQGPYDGHDDTLVGVLNLSTTAISSINLASNLDIMGFDKDGIDLDKYLSVSNPMDTTGYGGSNAYYTNISMDKTAGTVNFITPVAASGGTTYFALENSLDMASTCLISSVN